MQAHDAKVQYSDEIITHIVTNNIGKQLPFKKYYCILFAYLQKHPYFCFIINISTLQPLLLWK